jgi:hypothetical protein
MGWFHRDKKCLNKISGSTFEVIYAAITMFSRYLMRRLTIFFPYFYCILAFNTLIICVRASTPF